MGSAPPGERRLESPGERSDEPAARRRARRRLQPRPRRSAGRRHAGRPRRGGRQGRAARGRRRHPALGAAVDRRRRAPTSSARTAPSSRSSSTSTTPQTAAGPRAGRPVPTCSSRTSAPGALARRGLGYADVAARNPGVVYCSITGFGSREGADLPGYDFLVQAVGGLMSITGEPGASRRRSASRWSTCSPSRTPSIGILAALRARERTGPGPARRGQPALQPARLAGQPGLGVPRHRRAARAGWATGTRRSRRTRRSQRKDGHLAVCCGNDGQFRRLVEVLESPELADDPRFATNADRVANRARAGRSRWRAALLPTPSTPGVERLDRGRRAGRAGRYASPTPSSSPSALGLDPTVSTSARAPGQVAHPHHVLAPRPITDYAAPPRLGRAQPTRSAAGSTEETTDEHQHPHSARSTRSTRPGSTTC